MKTTGWFFKKSKFSRYQTTKINTLCTVQNLQKKKTDEKGRSA